MQNLDSTKTVSNRLLLFINFKPKVFCYSNLNGRNQFIYKCLGKGPLTDSKPPTGQLVSYNLSDKTSVYFSLNSEEKGLRN